MNATGRDDSQDQHDTQGTRGGKQTLSVAIVCKNNQATIGRTLDSVKGLATEIVAIDSGSTDNTIAILQSYGAKVISHAWLGHVKTKQLALTSCAGKWILSIDSDESVLPELAASIRAEVLDKANDADLVHDGFEVNRKVFYKGRQLDHSWQPEWRLRLVRNGQAAWGGFDPHDKLSLIAEKGSGGGRIKRLSGTLRHDSFVSFEEQFRKQVHYARLSAMHLIASGERGSYWKIATRPPAAFVKQLILKGSWRDGWAGWLAAACSAQQALMKHSLVFELLDEQRRGQAKG